jgi:hypothetical protein
MDMKKLTLVAIVLTSIFAVGLVSVNVAEGYLFGKGLVKSTDRATGSNAVGQQGGSGSGGGNSANQGIGQSQ